MDPAGALIVLVVFSPLACYLSALTASHWRSWRRIVRGGIPVTGTVVKVEEDDDYDPWATVEYRVGGSTHAVRLYRHFGQVGDAVPLLVDPADHDKAIRQDRRRLRGWLLLPMLPICAFFWLGALTALAQLLGLL